MEIPFGYGIEEHISLLSFLLPGHHEVLNKYAILCINLFSTSQYYSKQQVSLCWTETMKQIGLLPHEMIFLFFK